jgi:hypothetical protein
VRACRIQRASAAEVPEKWRSFQAIRRIRAAGRRAGFNAVASGIGCG